MRSMVYLDNAATTWPKPPAVASAMKKCIDVYCANPGRGTHRPAMQCANAIYRTREKLCAVFGASSPENIVFTQNATYAINFAIKSLVPYGHVILSDMEHNAVVRPVVNSGLRYGLFHSIASADDITGEISAHIESDTRAVIVNAASNICALTLPLEEIGRLCREAGLIFIVDASQAAGCHEIDMKKCHIDALCAPGHKGLYGPQGSGFVIFSDNAAKLCSKTRTLIEGGNGINSRDVLMPEILPERFEAGTLNVPGIVGLCEGIEYVTAMGIKKIENELGSFGAQMTRYLRSIGGVTVYTAHQKPSSIVLFNIDGMESESVAKALDEHGICVRAGLHCAPLAHSTLGTPDHGAVRISFGIFNTFDDVSYTAEIIDSIRRKKQTF